MMNLIRLDVVMPTPGEYFMYVLMENIVPVILLFVVLLLVVSAVVIALVLRKKKKQERSAPEGEIEI